MAEHPILFSGPMVRAILDGSKTQTRRVVTSKPPSLAYKLVWYDESPVYSGGGGAGWYWEDGWTTEGPVRCPYGKPGDTLWVRETWQQVYPVRPGEWQTVKKPIHWRSNTKAKLVYAADCIEEPPKWRPSIHMPRWASRIMLRLTDVRAQRVQEISHEDVLREGLRNNGEGWGPEGRLGSIPGFRDLWDSINAKRGYGWNANPWVWALTFEIAR